jgi:hypothetical protein
MAAQRPATRASHAGPEAEGRSRVCGSVDGSADDDGGASAEGPAGVVDEDGEAEAGAAAEDPGGAGGAVSGSAMEGEDVGAGGSWRAQASRQTRIAGSGVRSIAWAVTLAQKPLRSQRLAV